MMTVLSETAQSPDTRKPLYTELTAEFGEKCVLFYGVAMDGSVMIDDADADVIEGILQKEDLSNGLLMIINAPGGDGLAAERIINVCSKYSRENFEVAVPKMAKSAATMICFGANRIHMSQTSELGPVDPQLIRGDRMTSVHSMIESYRDLLDSAVRTEGNVEPYLQLLSRYDPSEIAEYQKAQDLAESISITALKHGMLKSDTEVEIRKRIKIFTDATQTSSHGRRIGIDDARGCGLTIEEIPLDSRKWELIWELYCRTNWCLGNHLSTIVETQKYSFCAQARGRS